MQHFVILVLLSLNLISCVRNNTNHEISSNTQAKYQSQCGDSTIIEDNSEEEIDYENNLSHPACSDLSQFPPLNDDPERCDFAQYMYAVYDCSDARDGRLDPSICIAKLEKLIEDYPDFYCESYHVRYDGSLIEISIKTRKDVDALLEEMLNYI